MKTHVSIRVNSKISELINRLETNDKKLNFRLLLQESLEELMNDKLDGFNIDNYLRNKKVK
jgi:hypothetical protein